MVISFVQHNLMDKYLFLIHFVVHNYEEQLICRPELIANDGSWVQVGTEQIRTSLRPNKENSLHWYEYRLMEYYSLNLMTTGSDHNEQWY